VLADQQLAEELRSRLRHEADGLVATDSLLADLGRRHAGRLRRFRLAATAASAVALVTVTVLAVVVADRVQGSPQIPLNPATQSTAPADGSTPPAQSTAPAGGSTAATQPPAPAGGSTAPAQPPAPAGGPTAEQLLRQARTALTGTDELIVHVRCETLTVSLQMRPDLESWVLESAGRARSLFYYGQSVPVGDVVYTRRADDTVHLESLDLRYRTISETTYPDAAQPFLLAAGMVGHPRDLLAVDTFTTDGRLETVNERQVYRLIGKDDSRLQIWLDAQTYRPVRIVTHQHKVDYEWLRATQENLALLTHEVPADFTRR
jgi:hypothetical protein